MNICKNWGVGGALPLRPVETMKNLLIVRLCKALKQWDFELKISKYLEMWHPVRCLLISEWLQKSEHQSHVFKWEFVRYNTNNFFRCVPGLKSSETIWRKCPAYMSKWNDILKFCMNIKSKGTFTYARSGCGADTGRFFIFPLLYRRLVHA